VGGRITAVPGSSDVFVGGIIAYADEIKREVLGVAPPPSGPTRGERTRGGGEWRTGRRPGSGPM
jgi:hypothetical protein